MAAGQVIALALALAQAEPVEPAHGVSDSIIATADETKIVGPARVCLVEGGIDLAEGEASYLAYLGIHIGRLHIVGLGRDYMVAEGSIMATPHKPRHAVPGAGAMKVARYGSRHHPRYALFGRPDYSPDADRLMIWVEGLKGDKDDLAILRRISVDVAEKKTCKQRFLYSWFFDEGDSK